MTEKPETKTVFKLFPVWRDSDEAAWLAEMSRDGWHFIRAFPGFYTFEKGEPRNFVYEFDFRIGRPGSVSDYLEFCRDAGWTHICSSFGWRYLRIDADAHSGTELFTDVPSLIAKYRRLLKILMIPMLVIMCIMLFVLARGETAGPAFWIALGSLLLSEVLVFRVIFFIRHLQKKYGHSC